MSQLDFMIGTQPISSPPAQQFYVANGGNDSGPGSLGNPWATVQHAADYVAGNGILAAMTSNVVVNCANGDYGTLALTDAHSGKNGFALDFKSASLGGARLLGGKAVTGWTLFSGNIYRAHVTGTACQTMWENDVRGVKARTPVYTSDGVHPASRAAYLNTEGVNLSSTVLQYTAGDLNPGAWNLTDAQVLIWSGGNFSWFTDQVPISSLNLGARQFTLSQITRYPIFINTIVGSRYFMQGVLDLLSGPGQFYYDSANQDLYYWPINTPINSQNIVVPTVQDVVTMVGADATHRCSNVILDGLAVQYSDFGPWYRHAYPQAGDSGEPHIYPQYDRQYTLPVDRHGGIRMENCDHVTMQRCHVKNHGFSGVFMRQYNRYCNFVNNWVEQVGHSGWYVDGNYPGEGDVLKTNMWRNIKVNDYGQLAGSGAGIALLNTGNNYLSHLDISVGPRYGLTIQAYIDGTSIPNSALFSRDNVVEYFKLINTCQDSGDVGGLYTFGINNDTNTPEPWTVNTFNQGIIDGVTANASMPDIPPAGVMLDSGSSASVVTNIRTTGLGAGAPFRLGGGVVGYTNFNVSTTAVVDTANIGLDIGFPY